MDTDLTPIHEKLTELRRDLELALYVTGTDIEARGLEKQSRQASDALEEAETLIFELDNAIQEAVGRDKIAVHIFENDYV